MGPGPGPFIRLDYTISILFKDLRVGAFLDVIWEWFAYGSISVRYDVVAVFQSALRLLTLRVVASLVICHRNEPQPPPPEAGWEG